MKGLRLPAAGTALAAAALAGLAILHDLLALGLDRAGLIERLLSPYEASALLAVAAALVLYALRLVLLVVGPGLVLATLALWALEMPTAYRTATSRGVATRPRPINERELPACDPRPAAACDRDRRAGRPSGGRSPRPSRSSSSRPGACAR